MSARNSKPQPHRPTQWARHIPAVAGFYVLELLKDENGYPNDVYKAHVIGLAFEENDEFSIPYPVTITGAVIDAEWLLQPDGTVEQPNGGWFPSLDDWLKSQQARHARGQ